MMKINLSEYAERITELRRKRDELGYSGVEDLTCMRKIEGLHHDVAHELRTVRDQLDVCPRGMILQLKQRETELLDWMRRY